MKILKITSAFAIVFLISLCYLMVTTPNPLDQQYDSLVHQLMKKKGHTSEQELLNKNQKLVRIKKLIYKIKKEHYRIQEIMSHPIPPSEEESQVLNTKIESVKLWIKEVEIEIKEWEESMERIVAKL